ncbi:MAG: GntR family transcriptional regulator [Cloacibacillus porcorum]|nr:GntR family transcriptional regulator [Cloacibacillus porcorum]MCD7876030.1 GntR family transcriptional regulator [Cloacibacillus porcorum]
MNEKRRQIIEKLLEKINSGEVVTGDRLLPERQLAEAVG